MKQKEIIEKAADFVKSKLENQGAGHDWWHVHQVWKLALKIAKKEKADKFIVQLGALFHDIADWKFNDDADLGPKIAREFLSGMDVDENSIGEVCDIIKDISFKGAGVSTPMKTLEGKIVQDADRLEALGAMGIARTFAYGGHKNFSIYEPDIKPVMHGSFEEYKSSKSSTINHFYEKLLLLKDRINTETGKKLAEKRHKFMERFLEQFFAEWNRKK
ncbi:MAG TPA: HD domain-containing protein [Candidatus Nanoarchaeia archaeon]|nr:HD domain-containing protein [Candidatus Nanoarchaeia archaeon]